MQHEFEIEHNRLWRYSGPGGAVIIPDGVVSIENQAFMHENLTSIEIPESVESIGAQAFSGNNNLEHINIPESVTYIGSDAFSHCDRLKRVEVPSTCVNLGEGLFKGFSGMADEDGFVVVNGILFDYLGDKTEIDIPEHVNKIDSYALEGNKKIRRVRLPKFMKEVESNQFCGCAELMEVEFPENLEEISYSAFCECQKLAKIDLPFGCRVIRSTAFMACKSLTEIRIPEAISEINERVFWGCDGLESIEIPTNVTLVAREAFRCCQKLKSVSIMSSKTRFGANVFLECERLEELTIPEGMECIHEFFFGEELPKGLVPSINRLYTHMTDAAIKKYICNDRIWPLLPTEIQALIFVTRHNKKILSGYASCISFKSASQLGQQLVLMLQEKPSAKMRKAVKSFLEMFSSVISEELRRDLSFVEKTEKNETKTKKPLTESTVEQCVTEFVKDSNQTIAGIENLLKRDYGITYKDLPPLKDFNGIRTKPFVLAWLLTIHGCFNYKDAPYVHEYGEGWRFHYEDVLPKATEIHPNAKVVLKLIDHDSLINALRKLSDKYLGARTYTKKLLLAYPICIYSNEQLINELIAKAPKWRSSNSGDDAPPLLSFRLAVLYNNARSAMMFADRYGDLKYYALIRGVEEETIRDKCLSDVGLERDRTKSYDLGNQIAVIHMQKDFSFVVELAQSGKIIKSLPQNNVDQDKWSRAEKDFAEIKKSVKKIVTNRCALLFKEFLSAKEIDAQKWKSTYLGNPLLRDIASLLVWSQGDQTFTLNDDGAIQYDGREYSISMEPILLAHPMDMDRTSVEEWQKYFAEKSLKQPFAQIWEPVRNGEDIAQDRYKGCMIPFYCFRNREKDGITVYDENFHEVVELELTDCVAAIERIDRRRHDLRNEDRFEITGFEFTEYNRQVNHIVVYLDKVTALEKIKKDDISVSCLFHEFSLAQILEFISVSNECGSKNCLAILLDEKNNRWPGYNGIDNLLLE